MHVYALYERTIFADRPVTFKIIGIYQWEDEAKIARVKLDDNKIKKRYNPDSVEALNLRRASYFIKCFYLISHREPTGEDDESSE